jgi:hypothetical protein
MATLSEIRDKILTRMSEALDEKKPTYRIGSREVRWTEYYEWLGRELARIDERIAAESAEEVTVYDDPFL